MLQAPAEAIQSPADQNVEAAELGVSYKSVKSPASVNCMEGDEFSTGPLSLLRFAFATFAQ